MAIKEPARSNALALAHWEGEGGAVRQSATQNVEFQLPPKGKRDDGKVERPVTPSDHHPQSDE